MLSRSERNSISSGPRPAGAGDLGHLPVALAAIHAAADAAPSSRRSPDPDSSSFAHFSLPDLILLVVGSQHDVGESLDRPCERATVVGDPGQHQRTLDRADCVLSSSLRDGGLGARRCGNALECGDPSVRCGGERGRRGRCRHHRRTTCRAGSSWRRRRRRRSVPARPAPPGLSRIGPSDSMEPRRLRPCRGARRPQSPSAPCRRGSGGRGSTSVAR